MKKSLILFISIFSFLATTFHLPVEAHTNTDHSYNIEYVDNGFYYETTITSDDNIFSTYATNYVTKTKTTKLKNADGEIMWSISIKATFSYDGTTAKCTNCSPSATSYASGWSIKNVTSSKSGNSATATGQATYTAPSGLSETYTKSVTLSCSATGVVS